MRLFEMNSNDTQLRNIKDLGFKISFDGHVGYKLDNLENFAKLAKYIRKNCSEALSIFKETRRLLYRGMSAKYVAFVGSSPKQRKPMSTGQWYHKWADEQFLAHGFKASRSNSIFCTSSIGMAASYGARYIIFPVNGFDFTWSPDVPDFFAADITSGQLQRGEFIKEFDYKHDDFAGALISGNEIMVRGRFVALNSTYFRGIVWEEFGIHDA